MPVIGPYRYCAQYIICFFKALCIKLRYIQILVLAAAWFDMQAGPTTPLPASLRASTQPLLLSENSSCCASACGGTF